eukprot:300287_1
MVVAIIPGLKHEYKGTIYNALLTLGGRTASECRPKVTNAVAKSRFSSINFMVSSTGEYLNSGRHITKRALIGLGTLGIVDLRNERGPGVPGGGGGRRGRGGPRFWNADVHRRGILSVWRERTIQDRRVLRVFIIRYHREINWMGYSLASGDGPILAMNDFWNFEKSADDFGDMLDDVGNNNNGNDGNDGNDGNNGNDDEKQGEDQNQ